MPRPSKPFFADWLNQHITGLYRSPADGRFKIVATGEKLRQRDPREAVAEFFRRTGRDTKTVVIDSPELQVQTLEPTASVNGKEIPTWLAQDIQGDVGPHVELRAGYRIPEALLVAWMKENSQWVMNHLNGVQASLKIETIRDHWKARTGINPRAAAQTLSNFNELVEFCGAKTTNDFEIEKVRKFKSSLAGRLNTRESQDYFFHSIRRVISWCEKAGEDATVVRLAKDKLRVLFSELPHDEDKSHPIPKTDFHALLKAGNGTWRPWLLLGLNMAAYLEELAMLPWKDVNLEKGTISTRRNKTGRCVRVCVLWKETLEELRKLHNPKYTYVFTSSHGTRFNSAGRYNDFAELREAAGVDTEVKWSWIRDGGYDTAINATDLVTDERIARVLVGHKAPGWQDRYVLRRPEIVAPAVEAIYRAYGPF